MKIIKTWIVLAVISLLAMTGCRSHVIKVSVTNTSSQPISNVIFDYPGATFGISLLAPGKTFPYVIKPYESGMIRIQFTNAAGAIHTYTGTRVSKGNEGTIDVSLTQDAVTPRSTIR